MAWTNITKSTASWSGATKHKIDISLTWAEAIMSWAEATFTWAVGTPYTWSGQSKNTTSYTGKTKH